MQCQACKEEINDAALICPHCRSDTPEGARQKRDRRWTVWLVVGCCVVGFVLLVSAMGPDRRAQCHNATIINPTVTEDECLELVQKYGDTALTMIAPSMHH